MAISTGGAPPRLPVLVVALLSLACAVGPPPSTAEQPPWGPIAPGVEYASFSYGNPPSEVYALRVDLGAVDMVVTPGGSSFGQVVGRSLLGFASEFDCVAAVNATPFYPDSYRLGEPRWLSGLLLVDGVLLSYPAPRFFALVLSRDGRASILPQARIGDPASIRYAVGGFFSLVADGVLTARKSVRSPMTAVGILEGGRTLVFVVADGRRPGSAGMSEDEAGRLLLSLGAVQAMSFDGGGSSAMVVREAGGRRRMVNQPVHLGFSATERVIGTCIGFRSRQTGP